MSVKRVEEMMLILGIEMQLRAVVSHMERLTGETIPVKAIMDECAIVAARHFTADEIEGIIAFHTSELGIALARKMPIVMRECIEAGQRVGARKDE